eukprot:1196209-Prorocentrum_minimum.AAC.15
MEGPLGYERRLGTGHLPEMIHGHNSLVCTHEASGFKICFDAFDALQGWLVILELVDTLVHPLEGLPSEHPILVRYHCQAFMHGIHLAHGGAVFLPANCCAEPTQEEAAPPLDVAIAEEWKNSHDLEGVKVMRYDWTYTTCYHGSLDDSEAQVAAQWTETAERIDREKLSVHEPILFFDECTINDFAKGSSLWGCEQRYAVRGSRNSLHKKGLPAQKPTTKLSKRALRSLDACTLSDLIRERAGRQRCGSDVSEGAYPRTVTWPLLSAPPVVGRGADNTGPGQ